MVHSRWFWLLLSHLALSDAFNQSPPSIAWSACLGGSLNDEAFDIRQTNDGGYILVGGTVSDDGDVSGNHGANDIWLAKLDALGTLVWQLCLGGSQMEYGYGVRQTSDHGYIVCGSTNSSDGDVTGNHGQSDFWVIKLSSLGTVQWQRNLGGSQGEHAYDVVQTHDGGYLVTGITNSPDGDVTGLHGDHDAWVVKLDGNGNLQWQRALGGTHLDAASAGVEVPFVGYLIAGQTYSNDGDVTGNHGLFDGWIVLLDNGGNIIWQHALGGSLSEAFDDIIPTNDGGYVAIGYTYSTDGDVSGHHGGMDVWVVKLGSSGALQWQRCLGGTGHDVGRSIHPTTDAGLVITGYSESNDGDVSGNHGGNDFWATRLDSTGNLLWQLSLGGSLWDEGRAVRQTGDGGYVIAGRTDSQDGDVTGYQGNTDAWVVKLLADDVGFQEYVSGLFTIAPNPTSGLIQVVLDRPPTGSALSVTDITGREVHHAPVSGSTVLIDLSEEPKGVYLVILRATDIQLTQRLVLE